MNANPKIKTAPSHADGDSSHEVQYRAGYTTVTVKSRFGCEHKLSELLFRIALDKLDCDDSESFRNGAIL